MSTGVSSFYPHTGMGRVAVVSRVVVTLLTLLVASMVWRPRHMEAMVDRVEADLVYYNRQPPTPPWCPGYPRQGQRTSPSSFAIWQLR